MLADRKAQDGDGLWAPFLAGAEASGSVLAQGASHTRVPQPGGLVSR